MGKHNGLNSGSLNMPFQRVCTESSMLSTNFLDSPRSKTEMRKYDVGVKMIIVG